MAGISIGLAAITTVHNWAAEILAAAESWAVIPAPASNAAPSEVVSAAGTVAEALEADAASEAEVSEAASDAVA